MISQSAILSSAIDLLAELFSRVLERNKFSIKLRLVFGTAGSTTERRGAPSFAPFAKDGAPGDLLHFLTRTGNAPFIPFGSTTPVDDYKESPMKFVDPTKPYRKCEGWGTRRFVAPPKLGRLNAVSATHECSS
jgi:hypothetical protein